MIDILEIDNFILDKHKELTENIIKNNNFSWYLENATCERFNFLSHCLLKRIDTKEKIIDNERIRSSFFEPFKNLFYESCFKNNINIKEIFRMNLNLTMHYPKLMGDYHVDHSFKHNNSVIYLNNFNKGNTFIFNETFSKLSKKYKKLELSFEKHKKIFSIKKEIKPKKYKAVFFNGDYFHSNEFCSPGELRLVLVTTFI